MSHRIGDVGKAPLTGSERKAEAELFSYMSRALTKGVVWSGSLSVQAWTFRRRGEAIGRNRQTCRKYCLPVPTEG